MSTPYLGNFSVGQTVYVPLTTISGAAAPIAPAADGTVTVYKDSSTSGSTTGVTVTRSFNSIAGINQVVIVTSDAFYAAGHDYMVVWTGTTVDGIAVSSVLATFSIQNRGVNQTGDAYSQLNTLIPHAITFVQIGGTGTWYVQSDMEAWKGASQDAPPTNAQLEARTLLAANYGTAAGQTSILNAVGTVSSQTGKLTFDESNNVKSSPQTAAGLTSAYDAAKIAASPSQVNAQVASALATYTAAKTSDIPTDYQQRGVAVTLPTGTGAGQIKLTAGQVETSNPGGLSGPQAAQLTAIAAAVGTLTVAERNAVADALLDRADAVETGKTLRQAMRIVAAVLAGRVSGAGTGTESFKGLDGSTSRVQVTTDPAGNRTNVNYTAG
jgi:hypothetical protein